MRGKLKKTTSIATTTQILLSFSRLSSNFYFVSHGFPGLSRRMQLVTRGHEKTLLHFKGGERLETMD